MVHKTNRLAVFSLMTGVLSLVFYIPFMVNILLFMVTRNGAQISFPFLLNVFSGAVFGLMGLITGNVAIGQIEENKDVELGHRYAVIGMLLSVSGMIVNIIFCLFIYFYAFYYD